MASIVRRGGGDLVEIHVAVGRDRKTIRLGRVNRQQADTAAAALQELAKARQLNTTPAGWVTQWVDGLDDTLHDRIARAGLIESRVTSDIVTIDNLIERARKASAVKGSTMTAYEQGWREVRNYFGGETDITTVEPSQVLAFKSALTKRLAAATAARRFKHGKHLFRLARRDRLITSDPFDGVKPGSMANSARLVYVTSEDVEKVIGVAPDIEWKLAWALGRYAGCRVPSEPFMLQWQDVLWDQDKLVIRSPKTEGAGKASRIVPMLPRLRELLQTAFDQAEEGAVHVLPRLRMLSGSLGTPAKKMIERAGLKPWPRTFTALRASRAMDWARSFPQHVATSWLGHTATVAQAHYLQTADDYYKRAVSGSTHDAQTPGKVEAQQKAQQYGDIPVGPELHRAKAGKRKHSVNAKGSDGVRSGTKQGNVAGMAPVGLEPTRPCGQRILNPPRLPIPPGGRPRHEHRFGPTECNYH